MILICSCYLDLGLDLAQPELRSDESGLTWIAVLRALHIFFVNWLLAYLLPLAVQNFADTGKANVKVRMPSIIIPRVELTIINSMK